MNIRFVQNSEIDKSKWDNCVKVSLKQFPYAFSWYLDIVAPQWDAVIIDNYEAVFPLPYRKKWGIRYVYPPFFIQQLGLVSSKLYDDFTLQKVLSIASENFKFIELYIGDTNQFSVRNNFELTLNKPIEEIRAFYSENTRRNIKKAEQLNLRMNSVTDSGRIVKMFRDGRGAQLKTLADDDYKNFNRLMDECWRHSMVKFYEVENMEGEICAGGCFVQTKGRIVFLFSGNTDVGRVSGAMHFMIDRVIKENASKVQTFDFEGSNDENLARFYKSFGAENVPYSFVRINKLPFPLNILKG